MCGTSAGSLCHAVASPSATTTAARQHRRPSGPRPNAVWHYSAQRRPRELGPFRRDYFAADRSSSAFLDARPLAPNLSPGAYDLTATPPPQWPLSDDASLPGHRDGLLGPGTRGRLRESLGSSHPHGQQRSSSSTSYAAREAASRSIFSVAASSDDEGEEGDTASHHVTDSPTPLSLPRVSYSRDALLEPSAADSPTLPRPLRVSHSRDALLDQSAFVGLGGAQRNTFGQAGGGTWGA